MNSEMIIDYQYCPWQKTAEKPVQIEQGLMEALKPNEKEEGLRSVYLINTRLWMRDLKDRYGENLTIGQIPESEWEKTLENYGTVWLMGIYRPSEKGKDMAKNHKENYRYALPNIEEEDIVASPFAVTDYSPNPELSCGWDEWDKMVNKLNSMGKKVIIDFVPNHTAVDHRWVWEHPEYYIQVSQEVYESNKGDFYPVVGEDGKIKYLAHGRDPYCGSWEDTLQLNYANPKLQEEMKMILAELAGHSDGVRCDMAMLPTPETFLRTWGWALTDEEKDFINKNNFWEKSVPAAKEAARLAGKDEFTVIAEAYWDRQNLEKWFDYIYNGDLYQHLKQITNGSCSSEGLKLHLKQILERSEGYRDLIYIENHDEERAVRGIKKEFSKATATLLALMDKSLFLVNQGQEMGFNIRPPMQIGRFPKENPDRDMTRFYEDLLSLRKSKLFQKGERKMKETMDPNLVVMEVLGMGFRAEVCVNVGPYECNHQVERRGENFWIYNLSTGEKNSPIDKSIGETIGFRLKPSEVKIIFLGKNIK